MTNVQSRLIGGKTIEDWDRLWLGVDGGLKRHQPQLRHNVGLYRISCKGQIMALGAGTDRGGGLAKRLSDFRRPSPSGRNHHAGELIYADRDRLAVEVLITGSDWNAREIGQQLKTPMIRLHRPSGARPTPHSCVRDDGATGGSCQWPCPRARIFSTSWGLLLLTGALRGRKRTLATVPASGCSERQQRVGRGRQSRKASTSKGTAGESADPTISTTQPEWANMS